MSANKNVVEPHGCIVCGKIFNLLVVYDPAGRLVDCIVMDAGGKRVQDEQKPLVACEKHSEEQIETALARHYPGAVQKEDLEGD
jgi:hypothetical protein